MKLKKISFEIDEKFVKRAEEAFKKYELTVEEALKIYLVQQSFNDETEEQYEDNLVREPETPYRAESQIETLTLKQEKDLLRSLLDYAEGRYKEFNGETAEDLHKFLNEPWHFD